MQEGMCTTSPQIATKLLHLHHVRQLWFMKSVTYFEARLTSVNWYCHVVRDGEIDPALNLFSDEVLFHCSGHVN
jgi:hypothetical protein